MRRFVKNRSLHVQLLLLGVACVVLMVGGAMIVIAPAMARSTPLSPDDAQILRLRLFIALTLTGVISLGLIFTVVRHLLRPLHNIDRGLTTILTGRLDTLGPTTAPNRESQHLADNFNQLVTQLRDAKARQEQSEQALAARTNTVDRLLEFSQTIQGAGKLDQIFASLCFFLQSEIGLAGLTILSHEADAIPAMTVKACLPTDLMLPERPVGEMENSLCPCLRQSLPRHFKTDGSPVRCAIDQSMRLGPDHAAYCIPFNIGGKMNLLVHMLMPPGQNWTDARKQLAHAYVNTAHSALMSLHLLSEAEKQSMTDALTGLFNRRSMQQLMDREVALCERHNHALSIVMIDMDFFKTINDSHGHAAGDHLLKSFADCVRITLRKTDLAFRYGGDEFVIALPQTPLVQAQAVVQKLRQAFASVDFTHAIAHMEHQPTLSIGVAERSKANNVLTLPSLLSAADQALYEAKNSNRNCTRVYQPPQAA